MEGCHSNAAYNRHLVNLKPRAAPAAIVSNAQGSKSSSGSTHILSPEHVNAAAQAGLAQAAALNGRVTLKSGSWDHVLCTSHSPAAGAGTATAWSTLPVGRKAAASNAGFIGSLPTTYCRGQVLQHSIWLHDGTDFTRGHMEQVKSLGSHRGPSHCA